MRLPGHAADGTMTTAERFLLLVVAKLVRRLINSSLTMTPIAPNVAKLGLEKLEHAIFDVEHDNEGYFWFIAQTGIIYDEKPNAPSNFHIYKLKEEHRTKVISAISTALAGSTGLIYTNSEDFFTWLAENDCHE